MIAIVGATGNIGKRLTEILLKKGQKVRAIVRNADKAKDLKDQGAELFTADVYDTAALTKAFESADAAFIMIPPHYSAPDMRADQNKISEALTQAIQKSGVKYVVSLSSLGAHLSEKAGPVNGLFDHEQRLNKNFSGNIIHLRPSFFMENHLMNVSLIKNMGIMGGPLKPDVKQPMIATQDIADEAANRLMKKDFKGQVVEELQGERDLSMKEVTRAIAQAIGKPELNYVQFAYEDAEKAMVQMGLSPDAARLLIEMNRSINEGIIQRTQPRNEQSTTPTSIEEFTKTIFAPLYSAK